MEMEQESRQVEQSANPTRKSIFQQPETKPANGIGTAGFVLALVGLFFSLGSLDGLFFLFLGLIFSLVGVFRRPKGLAIAGLVISCFSIFNIMLFLEGLPVFFLLAAILS